MKSFQEQSEALHKQMIAWRRDFHQHPELAFEEVRTAGKVASVLNELGLEVQTGVGKTGVVAVLDGQREGPTVLVRADMDALPILEENTAEYVSQTPNKMHACGHDAHTAIGLGVATMLAAEREKLAGRVKFVFQPAEEIGEGALAMIQDGVLANPTPEVALGLHVWSYAPLGQVWLTEGPMFAGADSFEVRLYGKGGHAALPDTAIDPVVAAAQIISASQTIVSRNVPAEETAVVSFTSIQGGEAFNVIPEAVTLKGTFRTFDKGVRETIANRFETIVRGVAEAMGCRVEIEIRDRTIPVVNEVTVTQRLHQVVREIAPEMTIVENERTMVAEDMSYFLDAVPGVFFFVGAANAKRGMDFPHHHPRFDIDEDALVTGATLLASAVGSYVLPD